MTAIKVTEVANGIQTVFHTPPGTITEVKIGDQVVTPKTQSQCSVTFAQAPAKGVTVEITVDR